MEVKLGDLERDLEMDGMSEVWMTSGYFGGAGIIGLGAIRDTLGHLLYGTRCRRNRKYMCSYALPCRPNHQTSSVSSRSAVVCFPVQITRAPKT